MDNITTVSVNVESIDEKQIPALIQSQFAQVSELRKEIEKATNNAYEAKECVVAEVGAAGNNSKKAITTLQNATLDLANAQVDAIKAQKKSFEYQQKLADITKFLFGLGLSNIAMNRVVVKELECKLRDASNEEIDDLARSEIENLLRQLKEQQDVEYKQQQLAEIVKEHDAKISELYSIIEKQNAIIEELKQQINK